MLAPRAVKGGEVEEDNDEEEEDDEDDGEEYDNDDEEVREVQEDGGLSELCREEESRTERDHEERHMNGKGEVAATRKRRMWKEELEREARGERDERRHKASKDGKNDSHEGVCVHDVSGYHEHCCRNEYLGPPML